MGNEETGEIIIRTAAEDGKVSVIIQDNGPGIPENRLKDVFQPFHTTKEEGTGLGLYITQQLAEKIKGRLKVQSVQGIGTTFTIVFNVCNNRP